MGVMLSLCAYESNKICVGATWGSSEFIKSGEFAVNFAKFFSIDLD